MRAIGLTLVVAALAAPAFANDEIGLPVGTQAPGFWLSDQKGELRSLSSFLGSGKLAVVFFRSADW